MADTYSKLNPVSTRLDDGQLAALEAIMRAEDRTLSQVVRRLVDEALQARSMKGRNWVDSSNYEQLGRGIREWQDIDPPYSNVERPINAGPPA